MASLVFGAVGAVIGFWVGGPQGAAYGFAIGSALGGALFPGKLPDQTGPRLTDLKVQTSSYGGMIPICFGTIRIAGNIIWAANLIETENTTTQGGKGGPSQTTTSYTYSANFAVSLCRGPIAGVRRIWADSTLVYDLSDTNGSAQVASEASSITATFSSWESGVDQITDLAANFVIYRGTETQLPDPTMEAAIGVGLVPAYRGQAYVVFNGFQLQKYGNRIPNFTFEVAMEGASVFVVKKQLQTPVLVDPGTLFEIESHEIKYYDAKSFWSYKAYYKNSLSLPFVYFRVNQVLMDGTVTAPDVGFSNMFMWDPTELLNEIYPPYDVYGGQPYLGTGYSPISYQTDVEGHIFGFIAINALTGGLGSVRPPLQTMMGVKIILMDNQGSMTGTIFNVPDLSWPTANPSQFPIGSDVNALDAEIQGIAIRSGQRLFIGQRYSKGTKAFYVYNLQLGSDFFPNPWQTLPGVLNKCIAAIGIYGNVLYMITSTNYHFLLDSTPFTGDNWVIEGYDTTSMALVSTLATTLSGLLPVQAMTVEGSDSFTIIQLNSVPTFSGPVPSTVWHVSSAGKEALSAYTMPFHGSIVDPNFPGNFICEAKRVNGGLWTSSNGYTELVGSSFTVNTVPLSSIVTYLNEETDNLTSADIDVTQLTDPVNGYVISTQNTIRSGLDQLQQAFFFDGIESDSKIKFIKRGAAAIVDIPYDELAAHAVSDQLPDILSETRQQEVELPKVLNVTFLNFDADYETGTQQSRRTAVEAGQSNTLALAIAMTTTTAKQIADASMMGTWVARTSYAFQTSYKYAMYEPTDIITIGPNTIRITQKDEAGGLIKWQGVAEKSITYSQPALGVPAPSVRQTIYFVPHTYLQLLDIPMLRDADNDPGFYFSASGSTGGSWPTAMLFRSTDGGANYGQAGKMPLAAPSGAASNVLGNFLSGNIFDQINSVNVKLNSGALSSLTELAILNGANACLLGQEIVQYKSAVLNVDGTYTLSGLLRGRQGTDWAMSTHAANERFVVLDPISTFRFYDTLADIGLAFKYKGVTLGDSVTASNTASFTNTAQSLKCYSPVLLGGGRNAGHDVVINWVRRTRVDGTWRDSADVSLGELTESYDVEVWDSTYATLKRTFAALSSPTVTYTSANQVTDFGSNQTTVYLRVFQNSATVGRGQPLQGTV